MEGWAKLHRKIVEWQWFKDQNTLQIFIYLIMVANHKTGFAGHGIEVKKGQRLTSVQSLMEGTGLSTKQVRNSLAKLEKSGEIEVKGANKYSLITICNYCKYQDFNGENEVDGANKGQSKDNQKTNKGQTEDKQGANEGQTEDKQRATNNNNKNNKNEENEKMGEEIYAGPSDSAQTKIQPVKEKRSTTQLNAYELEFEDLWRDMRGFNNTNDAKAKCYPRWKQCLNSGLSPEQIRSAVELKWMAGNKAQIESGSKYLTHLTTFINPVNVQDTIENGVVEHRQVSPLQATQEKILTKYGTDAETFARGMAIMRGQA